MTTLLAPQAPRAQGERTLGKSGGATVLFDRRLDARSGGEVDLGAVVAEGVATRHTDAPCKSLCGAHPAGFRWAA